MAFEWDSAVGGLKQERRGDMSVINNRLKPDSTTLLERVEVIDYAASDTSFVGAPRTAQMQLAKFGTGSKRGYPYTDNSGTISGMPPICQPG